MKITMLGTGAALPDPDRGQSAILLTLDDDTHYLFDCGEGATRQMVRANVDPAKVGTKVGDLVVQHQDDLSKLVREHDVVIGIITTPPTAAQEAAEHLIEAGVRSILNFAPTVLDVPPEILVREVDVAVELQILAFHEERRAAG